MSLGTEIAWDDTILPFQLDAADIRGRVGRLGASLERILEQHSYPAAVEDLVSEATMLTALIGQMTKLRWKLSLQIRGDGPIRLIATDYHAPETEGGPARLRAYASYDESRLDPGRPSFGQLGKGYFALLVDQGAGTEPYQGITPISGGSLAHCAETYFAQSEQLPTRFKIAAGPTDGGRARRLGGMMLQHMPVASPLHALAQAITPDTLLAAENILDGDRLEDWTRVNLHLDTARSEELAGPEVQPTELLVRLFHEENPRVFDAQSVQFGCTCSENRVRQSLSIYSARDIAHMTTPKGRVTADCQFCGRHYDLDPATLGFEAGRSGAHDA